MNMQTPFAKVYILTGLNQKNQREVKAALSEKKDAIKAARIAGFHDGRITECQVFFTLDAWIHAREKEHLDAWIDAREKEHQTNATNEHDTESDRPSP